MSATTMVRALGLSALALILAFPHGSVAAQKQRRIPEGPLITIYASAPQQYEIALDEVVLTQGRKASAQSGPVAGAPAAVIGATLKQPHGSYAVFHLSEVRDIAGLWLRATQLVQANPTFDAEVVLYEVGLPKSSASRYILTSEVGLVLETGEEGEAILAQLKARLPIRPTPGVPGGYVLTTNDPFSGLEYADSLRRQQGVRIAYPLLRRVRTSR